MSYNLPSWVWAKWGDLKNRYQDQLLGWRLVANTRARSRLGCCKYRQKTVELSSWLWECGNSPDNPEILNTLLHEVAHVLAPGDSHGARWRAACEELGVRAERVANAACRALQTPPAKYNATCPTCGKKFWRNRRPGSSRFCPCDRDFRSPLRWV